MSAELPTPTNRSPLHVEPEDLEVFDLHTARAIAGRARAQAVTEMRKGAARALKRWFAKGVVAPLARLRQRRRHLHELGLVDERLLKDIGVSRADLAFAIKNGVDPRYRAVNENRRDAAA